MNSVVINVGGVFSGTVEQWAKYVHELHEQLRESIAERDKAVRDLERQVAYTNQIEMRLGELEDDMEELRRQNVSEFETA